MPDRVEEIRERLEARTALAEYHLVPVADLKEALRSEYISLLIDMNEYAWAVSENEDIAYMLGEVAVVREVVNRLGGYIEEGQEREVELHEQIESLRAEIERLNQALTEAESRLADARGPGARQVTHLALITSTKGET